MVKLNLHVLYSGLTVVHTLIELCICQQQSAIRASYHDRWKKKKEYSYTSTPPIGRTACTDPQCLYSRAIPLLLLWAVRSVQSLSACAVQLYLSSPYGPYGLYRASVPVQYSYTSTPPMGRTACTEPQCLYSRAIPLPTLWAVRPVQSLSACTRGIFTFLL